MSDQPAWRRYARLLGADPHADTEDELSFHFEMRVRDYMRRGMSEADARRAAESRLGDLERVRRECAVEGEAVVRSRRRIEWFTELCQDVRYGMRTLLRAPTFTVMAVLTLAVGIGATTAIFSLVDAVLLAPLPYPQPERIVQIWETSPQGAERNVVSSGNVVEWSERAQSVATLGAYTGGGSQTLAASTGAVRVVTARVQPSVMAALGVVPVLGRTFVEEDAAGAGDIALIAHNHWQEQYGGRDDIVGERIVLDDVSFTVVGVLPPAFSFPDDEVRIWTPLVNSSIDPEQRRSHNLHVIGRLASGVTVASAQAEMNAIAATLARAYPEHMTGWGVNVVPLHSDMTAGVRPLFTVLLAGVIVVLLIVCGNLAGLLLVRAISREREMAVRGALGAGRARIGRQLLTENLLLAVLGGAGALLVAPLLLRVLVAVAPADIPLLERAAIDARMFAFAAVVAIGSALLFGLAPVLRLLRTDLQITLRGTRGGSGAHQTRLRGALLVAQVALSVVLLIGAGLFVRSFAALQATDPGYDPDNVVTMTVDLATGRYAETAAQTQFFGELRERVEALPGVIATAGTSEPPGSGVGMTFSFGIQGRPAATANGREDDEQLRAITPDYFDVMRQSVISGRAFTDRDRAGSTPVVILNESLARKHWPNESPVGQRIAFRPGETEWLEIVGVVADARVASRDLDAVPAIYVPYAQRTWEWLTWQTVLARTEPGTDPAPIQAAMRSTLLDLDPALPPQALGTVTDALREQIARRTFAMTLVTGFGTIALLLSVVGLYGLLAYSVAQQQREIGVRLALGAAATTVQRDVLRRSLWLALLGAAMGLVFAAAASRVIASLLYDTSPVDATTYGVTVLFVVIVALATASIPARRAARVSPLEALRSE